MWRWWAYGSSKSVTALSILRLVRAAELSGSIRFENEDLLTKSERAMRGLRGSDITMIFQEPMTVLNPLYTGSARRFSCEAHRRARRANARLRCCSARASRRHSGGWTAIRISCRAGSGSA